MKTNFTQAKNWITSAINDVKIVLNSLKMKFFALAASRCQLAAEKLNKAILSFIGLKTKKTHMPSEILNNAIRTEDYLSIDDKTKNTLKNVIKYSKFFEKQGAKTRYGILESGKLTIAEDVYNSFDKVKEFVINLKNVINCCLILLKDSFNINKDEFEGLKELELLLGELKQWV